MVLTSLPFTRETTVHEQDTTEIILEHEGEAKVFTIKQTPRQITSERKKKMIVCWLHCPSPRLSQNHEEMSPVSLQLLQQEKKNPRGTLSRPPSTVGHFARTLIVISHHGDCKESVGLDHWELNVTEKWEGPYNNQYMDLDRLSWYLWPVVFQPLCWIPNSNSKQWFCSFAEPSQGALWPRNLVECRST